MRTLTFLACTLLLFAACESGSGGEQEAPAEEPVQVSPTLGLEQNTWILKAYGPDDNLTSVPDDISATLSFQQGEPRLFGSAGCNNFFGEYKLTPDSLVITSPLGSTMMMCDPGKMEVEKSYLELLQAAQTFSMEGISLIVHCANGQTLKYQVKK